MHPHIQEVFALLDESRAALRAARDAVPPQARSQRPAPDRWSVSETLEHLGLVEARFEATVAQAIAAARAAAIGAEVGARVPLAAALRHRIRDRSERRTAPAAVVPTGRMDDEAAWTALERIRQRFRETVGGADGLALGSVTAEHHRWGALTVYQWLEITAAHEARHAEQIAETAAQLAAAP